jgi:glycosyltransferase involved in cell wall biosynthesis
VRVLHVTQPTEAGVARAVHELARDEVAAGWQVVVASPRNPGFRRRLEADGVRTEPWEAQRSPGSATAAEVAALQRVVRRWRPDLVHLHSAKAGLVGRTLLRGRLPTIFQPHAWSFHAVSGTSRRLALAWERRAGTWADRVVCVSEDERREGLAAGVRARWEVVPNGVDVSRFRPPAPHERQAARAALDVDPAPLVVCLGRLSTQKGQDWLLDEVWPHVHEVAPQARLVLVGDGPDRGRLDDAARRAGGVRLAGHAEDPRPWLWAADVVVQPSRWEGMPYGLLEAMACGACVVATDTGGASDLLAAPDDATAPAVAPLGSAPALAGALLSRLASTHLRQVEGARNRRRVVEQHDGSACRARMVEVSRTVCAERGYRAAEREAVGT